MQYTHNSRCNPSVFSVDDKQQQHGQLHLDAQTLVTLFNQNFNVTRNASEKALGSVADTYPTSLHANASEPIYLPADAKLEDYFYEPSDTYYTAQSVNVPQKTGKIEWLGTEKLHDFPKGNKLFFTRDYFASALHEIAHWCLAGAERRQKVDYGYWYAPDGRDAMQQAAFERVEIKPQAIEWAFSIACKKPFKVSNDNLSLDNYDSSGFSKNVYQQLRAYIENGFPSRAEQFLTALEINFESDDIRQHQFVESMLVEQPNAKPRASTIGHPL